MTVPLYISGMENSLFTAFILLLILYHSTLSVSFVLLSFSSLFYLIYVHICVCIYCVYILCVYIVCLCVCVFMCVLKSKTYYYHYRISTDAYQRNTCGMQRVVHYIWDILFNGSCVVCTSMGVMEIDVCTMCSTSHYTNSTLLTVTTIIQ